MQLEEWRQPGRTFDHRGHSIFYRDEGAGPVLVCIHGFPTASWDWHKLWSALTARFRVIAPDMIGFGLSGKPTDYDYSLRDQATLHEALLAELGVDAADILAHDYGDTVAQELLARHDERVARGDAGLAIRSTCFLNGGLFPERHRARLAQKLLDSPLGPLMAWLMNERSFRSGFVPVFGPNTIPSDDELRIGWQLLAHNDGQRVAHKLIGYIAERREFRERWVGALQHTRVPLRFINGPEDPVSGFHMAERYRELVPNPDVVLLDGIGHYPQLEAPERVLEAFLTFVSARLTAQEDVVSHRVERSWKHRLARLVPFGIGQTKPHHYRDMLRVAWENRDNPGYAWKVLSRGVCDGCALGVAGLHDWTIDGVHLCLTRLNLLRLNTMPALDPARLADVAALRGLDNVALRALGRLPVPLLRARGDRGFRRINWDEAYARIAARIRAGGAGRLAFYLTSRALTNETYYVAQKVARFLGTNNIDNAARLCHSPSTGALKQAIGVAATTCSYTDWFGTDLIIFFGSNPANDQPVAMKYLHEAKRRGTRVVLINPYREPGMERYWVPSRVGSAVFGTDIADYWFPVEQGGDIAFLYGAIKLMLADGAWERAFVDSRTAGFAELAAEAERLPWSEIERQSGVPRASIEEFAALVRDARTGVLVWSMGITQHAHGGNAVQMIANLGLLKGWVGRDHCGLMPIRGHSGVQGGAEMGAYATAFPGGVPIGAESARALSVEYGFPVPERPGLTGPEMVEAADRGQLDVLYCLGGNFLRALPDPDYVAGVLARVPLRVHQDIIVTDQMLVDPDEEVILLPAKTRYEQDGGGTQTSTERRIMYSPEIPRQVGEARAEWRILRELAATVDPGRAHLLGCDSGAAIRAEIAWVVPFYDGIQHLARSGDSFQYGGRHLAAGGRFPTADGKAHFVPVPLPAHDRPPGTFHVSTRRGKQFNTLIYADVDPLTGAARDAVLMNPDDASALHLAARDRVRLANQHGHFDGRVHLAPLARGNLQVHWPEGNVLIARDIVDPIGGVPDYNAIVRLERR